MIERVWQSLKDHPYIAVGGVALVVLYFMFKGGSSSGGTITVSGAPDPNVLAASTAALQSNNALQMAGLAATTQVQLATIQADADKSNTGSALQAAFASIFATRDTQIASINAGRDVGLASTDAAVQVNQTNANAAIAINDKNATTAFDISHYANLSQENIVAANNETQRMLYNEKSETAMDMLNRLISGFSVTSGAAAPSYDSLPFGSAWQPGMDPAVLDWPIDNDRFANLSSNDG